ncbi:MAG: peptide deformylase [Candidatus Omnitrophica bacterium]|nr:peptide deformylase [Candidatus Omnitrophota bacterium]
MPTKLRIYTYPERILSKKCRKVEVIDDRIRKLFDEMRLLMIEAKGVGIAANQVGIDLSMALIEFDDKIFKIVNPKILKKEGKVKFLEGCLSFPGLEVEICRAKKVWVSYTSEKNEPVDLELEGIPAIVFQHEIDHLNGVLLSDRISLWKKVKVSPKLKKIKKDTKNELSKQAKKY